MPHILKNKNIEIHIDLPLENYNFSRFDWTGKITKVLFHGIPLSGIETTEDVNEHHFGKGFYNEFGIDEAIGFDEAKTGEWFHKIGVGLLRKNDDHYLFNKQYEIKPADFTIRGYLNKLWIECLSQVCSGYSYRLMKTFELFEDCFTINYSLQNTGEKEITSSEYVHNFMCINNELINDQYILKFPFPLNSKRFDTIVNPENKVEIRNHAFTFNGIPSEQFFYSNLSGSKKTKAHWELKNLKNGIGISETGNFHTNKVNLWGWRHVISPELFYDINLKAGESTEWKRTYKIYLLQ